MAEAPTEPVELQQPERAEIAPPPEAEGWEKVREWRRQTREALIRQRLALPPHVRRGQSERARQRLLEHFRPGGREVVGFYYPIRGEFSCLDIAREHVRCGGVAALPVVVERSAPVEFWKWSPGARMRRGPWGIPIPEEREPLSPDVLIVPLVGFDSQRYRLGYGGGYYDRTLAAAGRRPYCIGVGYNAGMLPTICPQPHDIPLDAIVTERLFIGSRA